MAKNGTKFVVFLPISHCAPVVLSADNFFSKKRLCQFTMVSLYRMTSIWTSFFANFLQYEVLFPSLLRCLRCLRSAKWCQLANENERTALWAPQWQSDYSIVTSAIYGLFSYTTKWWLKIFKPYRLLKVNCKTHCQLRHYIHHRHLSLLNPKSDTHFTITRRVCGWPYSQMVYLSVDGHPSKY